MRGVQRSRVAQGLELPNRHYAAFIALDGHYLGYEDIALYCRLHDDDHGVTSAPLRVTVVTPSGELVSVTAHDETTIHPANQGEAEDSVRQAFERGDVVLVHQGAHFERARGFT